MNNNLLALILQDLVIFPVEEVRLEFNNTFSKNIIDESINNYNGELLIVTPKNKLETNPNLKDLNDLGIKVKIKKKIILPNGNIRVTLRGIKRCIIEGKELVDGFIIVTVSNITSPEFDPDLESAYSSKIKDLVNKYVNANSEISNSIIGMIEELTNLSKIVDIVSSSLNFSNQIKSKLFNETNYYKRAKILIRTLTSKIKETDLEKEIDEEVRDNFEKNEKDILIKEKIKILNSKLTYQNHNEAEHEKYIKKIEKLKLRAKVKNYLIEEANRLENTMDTSPEYSIIRSHLDFLISLPWNKSSKDETNIEEIDDHLNKLHYGLVEAKSRIEEYLILKNTNEDLPSPVLCLIGPPGTGKTTFARELASSIGREFIKISVGGMNDSSELIGHRRTYMGASPGKILDGIKKCGVNNPVILIDEVDKIVKDFRGDPASILLDILDHNQNKEFIDNYASIEFDLSNVIFILTANDINSINSPLRDRLEIIEVNSYTLLDKINIAKKYTMPRFGKEYKFDYKLIKMSDSVISKIIVEYTSEAGVRNLERHIASIIRKLLIKGLEKEVTITEKDIIKYLGIPKYKSFENKYDSVGIANVPACTTYGGTILNIECVAYKGDGIHTTGSLGKSTSESIEVAISYIKSQSKQLKIDTNKFKEEIHVHALDGGTPKDGTSAGLAITAALVSLLTNKKIPNHIAFTGEISLSGRILKVGGIEEKIISAYNQNITQIYIPTENINDLNLVNKKILKSIQITPVSNFTEVYNQLFS